MQALPSAGATAVEDMPTTENGHGHDGRDTPGKGRGRGKKKGASSPLGTVTLGGRVFALAELQRAPRSEAVGMESVVRDRDMLDLDVQSARLRLFYDSPIDWISAEIEFDMAGNPGLTDGYVQARGRHLAARFGRFKVPISVIALESPWTLPLVRRGLIHNLLVDWMHVGGRHPGATFTVRSRDLVKARLTVGAFQGRVLAELAEGDRNTDRINERGLGSQSLVARGQIELFDMLEIGASYEHRVGSYDYGEFKRYWTTGLDLVLDKTFASGGVRLWLDGLAGASWYRHPGKPAGAGDPVFVSGRALLAYRFGGVTDEAFYVEPYTLVGFLDPDTEVAADMVFQGVLGVNVGFYNRARLSLEANVDRAQRNFPDEGIRPTTFLARSPDRIALMLQGGVSF